MLQSIVRLYQQAYQGLSPSVWLLAGVMLINRCGTMVLPFLTLYLTQHLHYTITDAGIIMAVYGAGAFVGTFFGGRLTDRFGFYYVQLVSLLFGGAFLLVLQFVTGFYALCASVFIFTLFGDSFRPANQAAIAFYSEADNRTRAFSLNRLAINLGWAVGGGLGGWLAGISYNLLFWADGLTCLTAGIVLWRFLPVPTSTVSSVPPNEPPATSSTPVASLTERFASPYRDTLFIAFVICSALYFTVFMQLFSIVPLYFKEVLQMTEGRIGALMALNGILIVVIEMALVYRLEQQNYAKSSLIAAGVFFTAVSFLILATTTATFSALLFILLITMSEMLAMPFIQSFTVERAGPATRGQYLALYAMGGALAQTAAPAFGSQMIAHVGYPTHWLTLAGIGLVAAAGFWWLGRKIKVPVHSLSRA
ncbi:MFS transporter [Spirosoma utsteinense]|uniref:MFS family arabinose efflux permease n=1 Tax=Spirosoma utsteinense TaxID=2585773 RepID=A0ABR6W2E8_9BACT|nr:MFS transporter [Spirosoma utsteinense]MBC3786015.1 putative MFS family arabinose efflux permease [Spirosoma utsteinense]MBC3790713.1 putative MFS family arabinose efflux permease [Spirosoma utsteinense]